MELDYLLLSRVLTLLEDKPIFQVANFAKYKNILLLHYYISAFEQMLISIQSNFLQTEHGVIYVKEFNKCLKQVMNKKLEDIELKGVFKSYPAIDFFLDIIETYSLTNRINKNKERYKDLIDKADKVQIYNAYIKQTGKKVYLINLTFNKFTINKKEYRTKGVKVNILLPY
ncbi:MAG: hypothetical protein QXN68_00480 [Thermoplasmata archaeon]